MGSLQLPCTSTKRHKENQYGSHLGISKTIIFYICSAETGCFDPFSASPSIQSWVYNQWSARSNHWDGITAAATRIPLLYFQRLFYRSHYWNYRTHPESAGAFMIRVIRMIRKALRPLVPSILGAAGFIWILSQISPPEIELQSLV